MRPAVFFIRVGSNSIALESNMSATIPLGFPYEWTKQTTLGPGFVLPEQIKVSWNRLWRSNNRVNLFCIIEIERIHSLNPNPSNGFD